MDMEQVYAFLTSFTILGIPLATLGLVVLIILLTLLLRRLLTGVVIRYLRGLGKRLDANLDDYFTRTIEGPVKWGVLGVGLYIARLFVLEYISVQLNAMLNQSFQLYFIIVICWFFYRSVDVIIMYLQKLARRTPTELDDLLLPYLRKVFRIVLIVLVTLKFAEIFLGMSVAALLGILGGMGLTLGLVFKDIVANWFGCAIIYMDKLFQEGDWVALNDGKVIDADVEEIGLRSTKFRNFDKTVSIVPNDLIARSVVKNWSRMFKRRVKFNIKIDGVSQEHTMKILEGIRTILSKDPDVHQEFHMVNFREIEGNTRVIRLYYFTKTTVWKDHEQVRENINLSILKLFEDEHIDKLAYTIVDLSDDRPQDFKVEK